jgi:carbon monoxide dehydrogenase subunit G
VTVVEAETEVEAAPDEVWRVVADPRNLPRWDRRIAAVEGVAEGGLEEGAEYAVVLRFLGVRAWTGVRVLELDPPRHARLALSGVAEGVVETWVDPVGRGRSMLRHRVSYRFLGGPLGELAARAVRLAGAAHLLRRGLLAQKRQVEAEAARA